MEGIEASKEGVIEGKVDVNEEIGREKEMQRNTQGRGAMKEGDEG